MRNSRSQLRVGIILNYVNILLGNLIPVFYTPIMLSLLGQQEYGLYKLSSSVTSYLSLLSLGIGSAVTRYLIKSREEEGQEAEEKILGLFMIIFQIIALVSLAAGILLCCNLGVWYGNSLTSEELARMKILVLLMVINMALSFSQTPYLSVVNAHEKFFFLQCVNIVTTCLGPLLNLVVLFCGFASVGMAVSTLVVGFICRCAYMIYVKKCIRLKANYRRLPTHLLKEILVFSFWIFVANVVGQLYNATDTILIGAVPSLATVGVAVYNVGNVFTGIVSSMTTGISSLLAPKANKMVFQGASSEELTDLAIRTGRIQCYIITLIVTGFIVFGRPFISFYVGDGYADAYWVAVLIMVPNMIPLVQSVCLSIITAQNKHRFRSLVYLGIAIINVIGTWLLLKPMGIIGAALVTGLALIVGPGFLMNWYYHNKTGLNMVRFWKSVGKIAILPFFMCIITLILSHIIDLYQLSALLIGIIIYTILHCILNWRFVMNEYEKMIIREPLQKLYRKVKKT